MLALLECKKIIITMFGYFQPKSVIHSWSPSPQSEAGRKRSYKSTCDDDAYDDRDDDHDDDYDDWDAYYDDDANDITLLYGDCSLTEIMIIRNMIMVMMLIYI